ncbi:flavodoxin family protein [Pelosinus sp. UFO1]|uniref:flavodoxin family protein n=1 Tax=Pelosinus sp. UFO1 TaxID=484770 RepID=UPI0004D1A192|nr:flavodoxin family protein [Pelosinus sp. UFO1]AIF49756.1 NADPH-dependent FMN reductase [Pelosinus sp. UFO1]
MKIVAINGSPRKTWNTATLLNKALEGAASQGAETELIHLYDLNYKGCISCFACKTKDGKSYGRCPIPDDLAQVFQKVEESDAVILGSPIYLGRVTGEMAAFMDRFLFQYSAYTNPPQSLFPKKIHAGLIYTMNVTEEQAKEYGYGQHFMINENMMHRIFGNAESLSSFDTYQFNDYSKVVAPRFDPEKKALRREEVFPKDCKTAFDMGVRFATESV